MNLSVTKKFTLEMAHVLEEHEGPCNRIHGHSYILYVTITGQVRNEAGHPADGMIIDFKEFKKLVQEKVLSEFDHRLLLKSTAENKSAFKGKFHESILWMDLNPTCENILRVIAGRISSILPEGARLVKAVLHETATSFAEIRMKD